MPRNPVTACVCFVQHEDRLLLLQRNHRPFLGKWDGLGGRLHRGESPEAAAVREVAEESGLTIVDPIHRGHLELENAETGETVEVDVFVASASGDEPRASREGLPIWLPLCDAAQADLVGFVRVTLPRILVPDSFLSGRIRHTEAGDPLEYDLSHHHAGTVVRLIS